MNDMVQLLRTRRSPAVRTLVPPAPSGVQLDELLTIAARVPDHGKLVPWRFIVIEGAARERLGGHVARMHQADNPGAEEAVVADMRGRLMRAPLVVAVVARTRAHPKIPEWEQALSAGAAGMNLIVAAEAMGYGAVWLTEWYAYDRRFLSVLGLSETEKLAGFIHIGMRSEGREDRDRPALAEIVTRMGE